MPILVLAPVGCTHQVVSVFPMVPSVFLLVVAVVGTAAKAPYAAQFLVHSDHFDHAAAKRFGPPMCFE